MPRQTLQINTLHQDVADMSFALANLGYLLPKEIEYRFTENMQDALKRFQAEHELEASGICDDGTWKALKKALASKG